jgi:ABC-type spermidine/putrescine transport system permease subunit I
LDLKDFVCTQESAKQKMYYAFSVVVEIFLIVAVICVAVVILTMLWRRSFVPCTPRQTVGTYSLVTIDPNRAELEWDDKDLDHIWSTSSSIEHSVPRGP